VLALLGIAVVTALVIAAWRFGGPENERIPNLPQGQNPAAQSASTQGRARLVVRANGGSSWMQVREGSASGKLLYTGTLEKGQKKEFAARKLQLVLAQPENVLVRLNGTRKNLPDGTAFTVTAQRIVPAAS
jgi:hypothetical protein